MEGTWDISKELEARRRPFFALAVLVGAASVSLIFLEGLMDMSFGHAPLLCAGALVWLLTFTDIRIGFGFMILAVAISPEFTVFGIPNIRLEDFIFPAVFVAWISRALRTRQELVSTDLKVPILLLILVSLISSLHNLIYSNLPFWTSLFRLGKGIEYYLMFIVALNIAHTQKQIAGFVHLLWVAAVLVAVYSLFQLNIQGPELRVSGTPGETANILGGYLVFHVCLILGIASALPQRRFWALLLAACMSVPFVYTLSRASYVSLLVGLVLLGLLTKDRNVFLVLILVAGLVLMTQARDRFETILGILDGDPPPAWKARVAGWQLFLPSVLSAPLLGLGVGRAPLAIDNEYVRQIYELGIVGFVLFLVVIWFSGRAACRVYRSSTNPLFRGFGVGYLAGLVALLVHSVAATTFTAIRTTEPFFIATGLIYAALATTVSSEAQQEFPTRLESVAFSHPSPSSPR